MVFSCCHKLPNENGGKKLMGIPPDGVVMEALAGLSDVAYFAESLDLSD